MKIDMLFMDLLMVGLVFIPYAVLILVGNRDQKQLKKKFLREASQLGFKADELDRWNQNIVGWDKSKQMLLIVQKTAEAYAVKTVDLKNVKESRLLLENVNQKIGGKTESLLHQVCLELKLKSGGTDSIRFYDADTCFAQDYEVKNAEKWNAVVKNNLTSAVRSHAA